MDQGARLFTPRSTRAIDFFDQFETKHISQDGMFQYAKPESRQAIGMMYTFKGVTTDGGTLIYR